MIGRIVKQVSVRDDVEASSFLGFDKEKSLFMLHLISLLNDSYFYARFSPCSPPIQSNSLSHASLLLSSQFFLPFPSAWETFLTELFFSSFCCLPCFVFFFYYDNGMHEL